MHMKFYGSPEFKKLHAHWMKKLKTSGFDDFESAPRKDAELFKTRRRSKALRSPEETREYYLTIDHFVARSNVPKHHKRVLKLHTEGLSQVDIATRMEKSYSWVKLIISDYRKIIFQKD